MAKRANIRLMAAAIIVVLIGTGSAWADELHVPIPYGTIQTAIDDANNGDVVIVANGTYTGSDNKNLDFGGRGITVRSENGPEVTIIDCESDGRGFYFHNTEDGNSILQGFTITNGHVTSSSPGSYNGGAILCEDNSSPRIVNCIFITNSAQHNGGAIAASLSSLEIRNCTFTQNKAGDHAGAVILGNSNAMVDNCVFIENHCDNFSADGGAMFIGGYSVPTIQNCLFVGNKSGRDGSGGAIRTYVDASPVITNCTFVGNRTGSSGSSAIGGAICNATDSSPIINNCILWGNIAAGGGHEMVNSGNCHPTVSHCNILGGWNGPRVYNKSGSSVIDGGGNINADSLFVSGPLGDYYLSQFAAGQANDSPCVDTGSDLAINLGLANFTTRTDGLGDSGTVDIGYHYPASRKLAVDIKPQSCPNPVNVKSKGVLPVAILGTNDLDVTTIDPTSIRLAGVDAIRSNLEDVAAPALDANDCNCTTEGPDGFLDLTLKFKTQEIVEAIGEVNHGDVLELMLTGVLFGEKPIEGTDCILIRGKYKPFNKADINKDGVVDLRDFAIFTENWLQSSVIKD